LEGVTTITAIITCYKEGNLLNEALNSLYNQRDKDFNIILVNDCSPDETTNQICKSISNNEKIVVIRNEVNLGLSGSRNIAFNNMESEVAVFLDADDTLPYDAIFNIRAAFDLHPEADFIFGNYRMHYIEKDFFEIINCSIIADEKGQLSPYRLAETWKLLGTSPCKKKLWQMVGGYSLEFSNTCQDVDFWQRAILSEAKGYYINSEIYIWNRFDEGMNASLENRIAYDNCNYKNIEFYIRYSRDISKSFFILIEKKDYRRIKVLALYGLKNKKVSLFHILVVLSPSFFVPLICKFIIRFKLVT
jgi:glycosyltransferase involved in cell wall biosynthesis